MGTKPANGYCPSNVLIEVEPNVFLENATAKAFIRARAAAAAAGVALKIALPAGGYRSYDTQYKMKQGIPSYAYWNIDPAMKVSLAAPGYSSHGWGICVDIVNSARPWAIAHLDEFGFSRPFGDKDPGHFLFGSPTWNPVDVVLLPTQRQVLDTLPVRRRTEPTSKSPEAGAALPPSEIGNFNGWIHGENVNGIDIWFRGTSGNWFWAGGFTDKGTHDLTDLNPAQPTPKPKRTVRSDIVSARVRSLPTTVNTAIAGELAPGTETEVLGYNNGESITQSGITSDIWLKVATGWVWAGCFTTQDTNGLEKIVIVVPPSGLDPAAPWKHYESDVPDVAKWIGSPNYNRYPSKPKKKHFTEHWMVGYLAGTDSTFQNPGEVVDGRGTNPATNFGVGQSEVHQYVRLEDYQHGDGNRDSNTVGVSVEHEGGPTIPITDAVYANSARLHAAVMQSDAWEGGDSLVVGENIFRHDHWAQTSCCGTLDIERIARETNAILHPEPEPEPDPDIKEQLDRIESEQLAQRKILVALSEHLGKPVE